MVNEKFAKKGLDVRIDHRSYVRQGIDLIPTVHEGPTVRQMEAKGIRTDKGELNRWIKATNRLMLDIKRKLNPCSAGFQKSKRNFPSLRHRALPTC